MSPIQVARIALAALSAMVVSLPAHSQLFRSYLASDGSDANPCTLPLPCRLLPKALTTVADGGEIWMLDSANFNAAQVDVTKSVTILAVPGALGSVVAVAGRALNIATPGVKVTLRNLVIVPLPGAGGTGGIYMTDGSRLVVEGCEISGMPAPHEAIHVAAAVEVHVIDSVIRANTTGVYLDNGAIATITTSRLLGNSDVGVFVNGTSGSTRLALSDSTISSTPSTGSVGIFTQADTGATTGVSVVRSTISNNSIGILLGSGAGTRTVSVGASMFSGNGTALNNVGGGTFESLGNNLGAQNGANQSGVITPLAPL
jgi:nitrous oxidase accessory protein NosD